MRTAPTSMLCARSVTVAAADEFGRAAADVGDEQSVRRPGGTPAAPA